MLVIGLDTLAPDDRSCGSKHVAFYYINKYCFYNKIVVCTALFFGIYYTLPSILRLSLPRHLLHSVSPEHIVVHISALSCANHVVGKTQYSSSLYHGNDINRESTTSENPDHVISSLLHRQSYYSYCLYCSYLWYVTPCVLVNSYC